MNKLILSGLVMLLAFTSQAQTADEIIDNYFEITGGKELHNSVKSTKTEVVINMGQPFSGVMYSKGGKMKQEIDVMGQKIIVAFDGETAWMINPMQSPQPTKMPADATDEIKDQAEEMSNSPFLNYASKGHTIALEDETEEINGVECNVIKLTKKAGTDNETIQFHYFDVDSGVLMSSKGFVKSGAMKGTAISTYFSDYQETEYGLTVPFSIKIDNPQQPMSFQIKKVETNIDVDDSIFAFPGE